MNDYTPKFKRDLLKYAAKHSVRKAAEKFGVSVSSVMNWRREIDDTQPLTAKAKEKKTKAKSAKAAKTGPKSMAARAAKLRVATMPYESPVLALQRELARVAGALEQIGDGLKDGYVIGFTRPETRDAADAKVHLVETASGVVD